MFGSELRFKPEPTWTGPRFGSEFKKTEGNPGQRSENAERAWTQTSWYQSCLTLSRAALRLKSVLLLVVQISHLVLVLEPLVLQLKVEISWLCLLLVGGWLLVYWTTLDALKMSSLRVDAASAILANFISQSPPKICQSSTKGLSTLPSSNEHISIYCEVRVRRVFWIMTRHKWSHSQVQRQE